MNVLLDTSVWIDHFRKNSLAPLLAGLRSGHELWLDAVVRAELLAGCGSKKERRVIEGMTHPLKVLTPNRRDFERAGLALSRLREGGVTLRNPSGALLDALQAADSLRIGALLVTHNLADFSRLAAYIPCRVESFEIFRRRLWSAPSSS